MKVYNMQSPQGNPVANQFIIETPDARYFKSYDSIIVKIPLLGSESDSPENIELDEYYWDYSKTTGKYRNLFLGETKKETQAKIDSGEYILTNLN